MKFKCLLVAFWLTVFFLNGYTQETSCGLYSLTIAKIVNHENNRIDTYIKIDSSGCIFRSGSKVKEKVNIQKFSNRIAKFVNEEKIDRIPGNNDIILSEYNTPALNEQNVVVSIIFLADYYKEKNLINKTYYTWGSFLDKNDKDYSLFKYLAESEIELLKALLN